MTQAAASQAANKTNWSKTGALGDDPAVKTPEEGAGEVQSTPVLIQTPS